MTEELKPCPFCGSIMYRGVGGNKVKHPLRVCVLTDEGKDLWFDIKLWNTRTKKAKLPNPANPPAFPSPYLQDDPIGSPGMTLRDWFAGQALIGRLSRAYFQVDAKGFEEKLAKQCSAIADAMLAERAKYDQSQ